MTTYRTDAQVAIYRSPLNAGRGSVPASVVDDSNTDCTTRRIVVEGRHRQLIPMATGKGQRGGVHRRPGIDPTDPAWLVAAVVALVVLIVAVTW